MKKSEQIIISSGEDRLSKTATIRTYFTWISPTGFERWLDQAESLKLIGRQRRTTDPNLREIVSIYELKSPITIKMWTSQTVLGKPRQSYEVWMTMGIGNESFILRGLENFGFIQGRGVVESKEEVLSILSYEIISVKGNSETLSDVRLIV